MINEIRLTPVQSVQETKPALSDPEEPIVETPISSASALRNLLSSVARKVTKQSEQSADLWKQFETTSSARFLDFDK